MSKLKKSREKIKVAELEEEGGKMTKRLAELQKTVDSSKLENISILTTREAIFEATRECTAEAVKELEKEPGQPGPSASHALGVP